MPAHFHNYLYYMHGLGYAKFLAKLGELKPALQRSCDYSKASVFHGPKIVLRTIQNSVHPSVLCHSAATPGVCNGSQRPNTEG